MAQLLKRKLVQARLGVSHDKFYELLNKGVLPAAIRLTPDSHPMWLESEIDAFIEKCAAARNSIASR